MTSFMIRPVVPEDFAGLAPVLEATGLFPPALLPELFGTTARFGAPAPIWRLAERAGTIVGLAYAEPETFTEAAWNMRAIAVSPSAQAGGVGTALIDVLETDTCAAGGAIMIVDTAGIAEFDGARAFYRARGYEEEARIRDFWAPGVDKVTFRKAL